MNREYPPLRGYADDLRSIAGRALAERKLLRRSCRRPTLIPTGAQAMVPTREGALLIGDDGKVARENAAGGTPHSCGEWWKASPKRRASVAGPSV